MHSVLTAPEMMPVAFVPSHRGSLEMILHTIVQDTTDSPSAVLAAYAAASPPGGVAAPIGANKNGTYESMPSSDKTLSVNSLERVVKKVLCKTGAISCEAADRTTTRVVAAAARAFVQ